MAFLGLLLVGSRRCLAVLSSGAVCVSHSVLAVSSILNHAWRSCSFEELVASWDVAHHLPANHKWRQIEDTTIFFGHSPFAFLWFLVPQQSIFGFTNLLGTQMQPREFTGSANMNAVDFYRLVLDQRRAAEKVGETWLCKRAKTLWRCICANRIWRWFQTGTQFHWETGVDMLSRPLRFDRISMHISYLNFQATNSWFWCLCQLVLRDTSHGSEAKTFASWIEGQSTFS